MDQCESKTIIRRIGFKDMKTILVKFRTTGESHRYRTDLEVKVGERVLVETEAGTEVASVMEIGDEAEEVEEGAVRKITPQDQLKKLSLRPKEEEARLFCAKKIKEYGLPMRLLDVELSLDERKLTFYFFAEERIDFRELLRDLVSHFRKNIRLQQVSARESAQILGGIGPCGRPFCCWLFLENMGGITLEMVKEQDLTSGGLGKTTGPCGKLLCCLAYEIELYKELRKNLPPLGSLVRCPEGQGKVVGESVLRQTVLVELENQKRVEVPVKEVMVQKKGEKDV